MRGKVIRTMPYISSWLWIYILLWNIIMQNHHMLLQSIKITTKSWILVTLLTDSSVSAFFMPTFSPILLWIVCICFSKAWHYWLHLKINSMVLCWCHSFGYQTSAEFVSLFWIIQRAWLMATICFVKGIFQSIQNNTNTNILPKYSIE